MKLPKTLSKGDRVRVCRGFHKGRTGIIEDFWFDTSNRMRGYKLRYWVTFDNQDAFSDYVDSSYDFNANSLILHS